MHLGSQQPTATATRAGLTQPGRPMAEAFGGPRRGGAVTVAEAYDTAWCSLTHRWWKLGSTWGETNYDTPATSRYMRPLMGWPETASSLVRRATR
jgi:hypothetical protein